MAGSTTVPPANRPARRSIKFEQPFVYHAKKSSISISPPFPTPIRTFSIADFFAVCSALELDWLLSLTTSHLKALLASPDDPATRTYSASYFPAHIPLDRGRRSISWPLPSTDSSADVAAFLAGLTLLTLEIPAAGPVSSNKASRVRAKLTTLTFLSALTSALSDACPARFPTVLARASRLLVAAAEGDVLLDEEDGVILRGAASQLVLGAADGLPLRLKDGPLTPRATLPSAILVTRPARQPRALSGPSSTLVIPSAGRSSRFPGHKPKWLLTMPNGRLMVVDAIAGLDLSGVSRVVLGVLKEHVDKHCGSDISALLRAFEDGPEELADIDLSIVVINAETVDQVQTIEVILNTARVSGAIFLKDCDNQFACAVPAVDGVATLEISREMQSLNVPAGKSYVDVALDGSIHNIVEKVILGPTFCVGGYAFASAADFTAHVAQARKLQKLSAAGDAELAVSDVIWLKLIKAAVGQTPCTFQSIPVADYEDWGTLGAWKAYCATFRSLFLDIDGTLVKNSGQYFGKTWGEQPGLDKSVAHLQNLYARGRTQIILTTSRTEAFREATEQQLRGLGIPYDRIVFGMFHCQRVLVNDFAKTNPFPSASAINLRRDGDELSEMLDY
ncbi:hypothetical protein EJ06DRAFT_534795 [Trichodelitschia bisporula]|uniref:HAD-like protein n=1 Tax=Trichodelitschia bisporula TaxID=703511 RepID=A0A6G1HI35_9PEZI|nr:hypothetical protein EJ06DRAFT_534795 [Trichodelitschia bisporula]